MSTHLDDAPVRGKGLVAELLLELEQLPPAQAAALRVVQIIDDPHSSSKEVAAAASIDPVPARASAEPVPCSDRISASPTTVTMARKRL